MVCSERGIRLALNPAFRSSSPGFDEVRTRAPDIDRCARLVSDQVWIIPAPETGERTRAVLGAVTDDTARQLATDQRIWFIDAGRLDETNPSLTLVGPGLTRSTRCRRPNRGPRAGPDVRRTAPEAM